MKTLRLGTTGVEVSALCLGTMRYGSSTDMETSYQLLDMYVDAGGSFLDTANIYGRQNESELLLGKWMRQRQNRSRMFVATKVGFGYAGVERGLRSAQIEAECEKTLQRLGVETIDLYYAHRDDPNTPMEETLEAFDRLVTAGKVRLIGASNFPAWRLEEARWVSEGHSWAQYCCVQQRYSYIRPKSGADFDPQIATNDDLLDYCRARGITMLAYSPLLSGAYTRSDRSFREQYQGLDTDARLRALQAVAAELGATANQVVLAWMLQSEQPVIPLVGASTVDQLRENLGALAAELSSSQMARMDEAAG